MFCVRSLCNNKTFSPNYQKCIFQAVGPLSIFEDTDLATEYNQSHKIIGVLLGT